MQRLFKTEWTTKDLTNAESQAPCPGLAHFIKPQLHSQMTQVLQSTKSNKHSLYQHAHPEQYCSSAQPDVLEQ